MKAGLCGVYKINNRSNNRFYIGSTNNLRLRKNKHFNDLKKGKHHSPHLQRAYNKKPDDIEFQLLIVCSVDMQLFYEQILIDALNPFYNSSKLAGRVEMTQNVREKISKAQKAHFEKTENKTFISDRMLSLGEKHWMKEEAHRLRMKKNNPLFNPSILNDVQEKGRAWRENNKNEFMASRKLASETLKRRNAEDPTRLIAYSDSKNKAWETRRWNKLRQILSSYIYFGA